MSELKLFWYEKKELRNPVAVIGLPSIGLVGSITSSFLSRELRLDVVAGMTYPDIQQYTILQDGNAYPPIRIYAGPLPKVRRKRKTQTEGGMDDVPADSDVKKTTKRTKVRDIIVVTSEVAAKPEFVYTFTLDILEVVRSMGAQEIIFVDGIPNTDPASMLMAAYSTDNARNLLEKSGIPLMKDGIVRGVSGAALFQGKMDAMDVVCLISPANPQLPDPRAAATALEPLSRLIPRMEIDPSPLFKEAEEIENKLRAQQTQQYIVNSQNNLYG